MKRELRDRWIKALRSGDYLQARNYLEDYNEAFHRSAYCCLGVLCIVDKGEIDDQFRDGEELNKRYLEELDWLSSTMNALTNMNDGVGQKPKSFDEIADWIEQNIEAT